MIDNTSILSNGLELFLETDDDSLRFAQVDITNAQLLNLVAAPVVLVPQTKQGINQIPLFALARMIRASTAVPYAGVGTNKLAILDSLNSIKLLVTDTTVFNVTLGGANGFDWLFTANQVFAGDWIGPNFAGDGAVIGNPSGADMTGGDPGDVLRVWYWYQLFNVSLNRLV